ncbi:MAG TPA: hypothetical protein VFU90_14800 [Candidatus Tumulicola sp.]|nr:hypothetical protein [Candidatus Tumulicola sp.]
MPASFQRYRNPSTTSSTRCRAVGTPCTSSGPSDGIRSSDSCDARYVSALIVNAGSGPKKANNAPPATGVTRYERFSEAISTPIASVDRSRPSK